jgi:hypothetical protein
MCGTNEDSHLEADYEDRYDYPDDLDDYDNYDDSDEDENSDEPIGIGTFETTDSESDEYREALELAQIGLMI